MDVQEMYEDFRNQFPELTRAADVRHLEIWNSVELETLSLWFESLAGALNSQMGDSEQHTEFAAIFKYFDMKFRTGSKEVKNCIDVNFVENLFWDVVPRNAAPIWANLPKNLQQQYVDFHGRSPKLG